MLKFFVVRIWCLRIYVHINTLYMPGEDSVFIYVEESDFMMSRFPCSWFYYCFKALKTYFSLYIPNDILATIIFQSLIFFYFRNAVLEGETSKLGFNLPAARKTGTTICGVVFKVRDRFTPT